MSAQGFMQAWRSFGSVVTQPHRNEIKVAASACQGSGSVSVAGYTESGHHIGGLLTTEDARSLIVNLERAIGHAEVGSGRAAGRDGARDEASPC